jgi:pimeloyl-ACP methyl ester carboxylesterase
MASGDITHRTVETNGIRMHIAEQGEGPLVVLCHGFPESWYSWRHQLPALRRPGFMRSRRICAAMARPTGRR